MKSTVRRNLNLSTLLKGTRTEQKGVQREGERSELRLVELIKSRKVLLLGSLRRS